MKGIIKRNLFTGFIVLLPITLFGFVMIWLFSLIAGIIAPFTAYFGLPVILTVLIALFLLLFLIFLVGAVTSTQAGKWFFQSLENNVLSYLPGYKFIKQMLDPFIGDRFKKSFKSVVLVDIWGNGTLMTAFVTDKTAKYITVFVPTGPNPTSGNIYHVPTKRVQFIDAPIDQVLRSVIAVGAGSAKLVEKLKKQPLMHKTFK